MTLGTATEGVELATSSDAGKEFFSAQPSLLIHYFPPKKDSEEERKGNSSSTMAVCVKPFHYDWNRALWLVEFLEFYKLLGASHFVFYNDTLGADVDVVLADYASRREVTIMK